MLLLFTMCSALALTARQGGPSIDLGAGLSLGGSPFAANAGGHFALGWWTGTYDDQFSFGKYWSFGLSNRFDFGLTDQRWSLAPMFEIRRGLELIVVGVHPFLAGGPILVAQGDEDLAIGWTARAGIGGKFRRSRFFGLTARIEGGVDSAAGAVSPAFSLLLGGAFARPAHAIKDPET